MRQRTPDQVIKDKYKDSITQFLRENTLYDCLAHNNQVVVLDQSFSCWDVFQIFIQNNLEEVLFWNSDISNYDGVFTHSDLIKVILRLFNSANMLKHRLNLHVIEEENEDGSLKQSQSNFIQLKFYHDLKSITIRQWFNIVNDDVLSSLKKIDMSGVVGLVKGKTDEKLYDACSRITRSGISRIIIVDPESQMIMGTLHQKDVLVFIIKGFTQYYHELKKHTEDVQSQHKLKIKSFYNKMHMNLEGEPMHHEFSCSHQATVFQQRELIIQSWPEFSSIYRAVSMPIVNDQKQFIGLVCRRDILIIIKYEMFEMSQLDQPITVFLDFLAKEKAQVPANKILRERFFNLEQTVREVVESLVLSENNCLIALNPDNTIQEIISIPDVFGFLLNE